MIILKQVLQQVDWVGPRCHWHSGANWKALTCDFLCVVTEWMSRQASLPSTRLLFTVSESFPLILAFFIYFMNTESVLHSEYILSFFWVLQFKTRFATHQLWGLTNDPRTRVCVTFNQQTLKGKRKEDAWAPPIILSKTQYSTNISTY